MRPPLHRLLPLLAVLPSVTDTPAQTDTLRFVTATGLPGDRHETHSLAAGDIDGDGDLDLVLGNVGPSALLRNRGDGTFERLRGEDALKLYAETNAVALVDFDGDGHLDLFSASGGWFGAINNLLLGDGRGRFVDATDNIPQDYGWTNGIGVGDLDGDGDLDLLLGRLNRSDLLLNDGEGRFVSRMELLPELRAATMAVALGDLDGDGDLDAVLGNAVYDRNRIWINDGRGHFADETARRLPADQDDTFAVALGDVDGDGDLDLMCGNGRLGGEQPKLYLNDGTGVFADATSEALPVARCQTLALAMFDLDADGDLDLVLGNADGAEGATNLLWLNDGDGRFSEAAPGVLEDHGERTACLLPVDLDADGRPELVVGNAPEGGARPRLLRLRGPRAKK